MASPHCNSPQVVRVKDQDDVKWEDGDNRKFKVSAVAQHGSWPHAAACASHTL